MRILFIIRSLDFGGAQRQLVLLANELAKRGHKVIIVVFYADGALGRDLEPQVRLLSLQKRSRWDLLAFSKLIRILRTERPSVIHGYLTTGNLLATLCSSFCPGAAIIWGIRASDMQLRNYDWTERATSGLENLLSRSADCIIVNSAAGIRHAESRGFPRSRMRHVPNGIDTTNFYPDRRQGLELRRQWRVDDSQRLVGLIGRLDPMKGHAMFLQAAFAMAKARPDVRFLCMGDGPAQYRERLFHLTREMGLERVVLWEPSRPGMRAVYNALDVFCSASSYGEGFPNVLGEAMACGLDCVATDVGDSGFVLGDTGTIVAKDSPDALSVAVLDLLKRPSFPNEAARRRIVEQFSVAVLAERTEAALPMLSENDYAGKMRCSPCS